MNVDDFLDKYLKTQFGKTHRFGDSSPLFFYETTSKVKKDELEYETNTTKDGSYFLFEVPGFNKTNLEVYVENNTLVITGKRTYKLNGDDVTKSIDKKINIGEKNNPESVEATIDDGILTVFIPNFKSNKKKRINII